VINPCYLGLFFPALPNLLPETPSFMKALSFLAAALLTASATFAQAPVGTELAKNDLSPALASNTVTGEANGLVHSYTAYPENEAAFGQGNSSARKKKAERARQEEADQDQARKEKDGQGRKVSSTARETQEEGQDKGQTIKEVATAKRQSKPEKVDLPGKGSAARPQSAARPVRGAAIGAVKAANGAAKAVRPVKVGGAVGVGKIIKVGKN
jgi:hypothetical protein